MKRRTVLLAKDLLSGFLLAEINRLHEVRDLYAAEMHPIQVAVKVGETRSSVVIIPMVDPMTSAICEQVLNEYPEVHIISVSRNLDCALIHQRTVRAKLTKPFVKKILKAIRKADPWFSYLNRE